MHVNIIIHSEVSTFPIVIIFSVFVCLRCLLHHILLLIEYTFREKREFVFTIIVQFMSANSRIRFGLKIVFVYLYIIPSHNHHSANLSEDIEQKYGTIWLMLMEKGLSAIGGITLTQVIYYITPLYRRIKGNNNAHAGKSELFAETWIPVSHPFTRTSKIVLGLKICITINTA